MTEIHPMLTNAEELHDCLQAFRIRAITGANMIGSERRGNQVVMFLSGGCLRLTQQDLSDDLVVTFSELKIFRRSSANV
ncbi:unnamed protein product [Medioppia subpectinata]|uniref:Uncharacterized protein n=1 Tax=Medioppia subpectinata TaxID=1979941 RepID=A0A7R9KKB6_9ACAR|nr:unnamed protein product [Medioppia subpectinata]CAG2105126.1 unnamed protein product [Medioppia subpectinata]